MMVLNEGDQVGRTQVFLFLSESIRQIQAVNPQLIGHDGIAVIRYAAGNPVMAADGLHPPDLIGILKADAVHLIRAVLFQQTAEQFNAFSCAANVGKNDREHIFLPDPVLHQRIRTLNPCIARDGLRRRHGHMAAVDACFTPDSLVRQGIGGSRIPQGLVREFNSAARKHRDILPRLVFRIDHKKTFRGKRSVSRVFIARHEGGSVIGCFFSDKNGCAGHSFCSSCPWVQYIQTARSIAHFHLREYRNPCPFRPSCPQRAGRHRKYNA